MVGQKYDNYPTGSDMSGFSLQKCRIMELRRLTGTKEIIYAQLFNSSLGRTPLKETGFFTKIVGCDPQIRQKTRFLGPYKS